MRKYKNNDYNNIIKFLGELYQLDPNQPYWPPSRFEYAQYLVCPLYLDRGLPDWKNYIAIIEDNNKIVGVINSENPDANVFIHTHPEYKEVEEELIVWAEKNMISDKIIVWAVDNDTSKKEILAKRGYQELEINEYLNWCDLESYNPQITLPDFFEVKSFVDGVDLDHRIECAARAFGSKKFPNKVYHRMQEAPNYDPFLDLYITYKKDKIVSFCTVWKDIDNNLGYFEPVGTDPNFQKKGLGKAILNEGMKRLKEMNIKRACVGAYEDERKAFYNSSGFTERVLHRPWKKVGI